MDKITARKEYLALRKSLSVEYKNKQNEKICARILEFLKDKEIDGVLSYASYKTEVDTWKVNVEIMKMGYKLYLPRTGFKDIQFYGFDRVKTEADLRKKLRKNKYGIMDPMPDTVHKFRPKAGKNYLCLVPGVAFDKVKHRMGYGRGFYDSFLSEMAEKTGIIKVGISYDMCIFPEIPYDEHDVLMDYVLTGDNLYE